MNTAPGGVPSSARAYSEILPRRDSTVTISPAFTPDRSRSAGWNDATGSGSMWSSTLARRVIAPVCQCSSWRLDRLSSELNHAVGVGDCADLLRPGGCRQHHVGEVGGFGEEDVLNHHVIE